MNMADLLSSKLASSHILVLSLDRGQRCQYRNKADKAHLILHTLDEFDTPYLRALLQNDANAIKQHEESARQFGYGPRAPCTFAASPSAQKELCREHISLMLHSPFLMLF
jgi:hypothetical protein